MRLLAFVKNKQCLPLSVQSHLKHISECENLGKGGSLAPARDSVNDVWAERCRILLYIQGHLALNCNLQMSFALLHAFINNAGNR